MNNNTTNCEHNWEPIIDGSPDYLVQVCMNCGLEHSTDLHTGQHTYVQGTHNPLSKPTHAGRKVMDYPDGISVEIYAAPVAPTSADVDADRKRLREIRQIINADRSREAAGIPLRYKLRDICEELLSHIDRLTAANAALRAELDGFISGKIQPTGHGTFVPAPNGGETAAHLCSVIGCGKVATHVSDVPYRDGVQAHYCDEHTLYERPIETAAETIDRKAWGKLGDKLDGSYYDANAQPTTARKLSKGVKLTETQETVLQVAVRRGGQMRGDDPALIFRGAAQSLQACVKRDWLTFNYEYNRYTITPAGVAALAASESEAGTN